MNSPQSNLSGDRVFGSHITCLLFLIGALFWPVLTVFTAIELHLDLGWFSPSNRLLWGPLAVAAFFCALAAPFLGRVVVSGKIIGALISVGANVAGYFLALLVGMKYLHWYD
jgi:hypothetical protein